MTLDQSLVVTSILAILFSPLIALEIQKRLDDRRDRRRRKLTLFSKLMTTRATDISPAHVEALNSIEVEFYAKDGPDKKVLDAWRIYINHVNTPMGEGAAVGRWVEQRRELLVELIYVMGQNLGYDIDKLTIKNNAYYPKGHAEIEGENHELRKAMLKVFSAKAPIVSTILGPVEIVPPLEPPAKLALPPQK